MGLFRFFKKKNIHVESLDTDIEMDETEQTEESEYADYSFELDENSQGLDAYSVTPEEDVSIDDTAVEDEPVCHTYPDISSYDELTAAAKEMKEKLIDCQEGDSYGIGFLSEIGSVLFNSKHDATDDALLHLKQKKLEEDRMAAWSLGFYKARTEAWYHSIYYPTYETDDGVLTGEATIDNPAYGHFYRDYRHIATKYGSAFGSRNGIHRFIGELTDYLREIDAVYFSGTVHVCMECYDFKDTTNGVILYLRDFKDRIETLPVDFISGRDALALKGRMLACELLVHTERRLLEVSWIRVLRFDKNGFVCKNGLDEASCHVSLYDDPSSSNDYEYEFGRPIESCSLDDSPERFMKFRCTLNIFGLDNLSYKGRYEY